MNNRVRVGEIRPPDGEILAELGKIQALCKLIAGGLHLHCGMCLRNHHARDRDVERLGDAVADNGVVEQNVVVCAMTDVRHPSSLPLAYPRTWQVHAYSPMPHAPTHTLHPCGLTVVPKATVDVPKRQ